MHVFPNLVTFMQCSFKLLKEAGALCVEYCDYETELFTHSAFQSIEKQAFQRRIKNPNGAVCKQSSEGQFCKSNSISNLYV